MEPVTAIGLASAILSFIKFSWDLVSGTAETYRSIDGVMVENARLEDVISDLHSVTDELSRTISSRTPHERAMGQLAQRCRDDAELLIDILRKLKTPGKRTAWTSIKTAWKNLILKDDIAEMKERLGEYRSEILLNLTLMLRDGQSGINTQLTSIRDDCNILRIDTVESLQGLRDEIMQLAQSIQEAHSHEQEATEGNIIATNQANESLADFTSMLKKFQEMTLEIPIQHRILRHLVFDGMRSRRSQIMDAKPNTFEWILATDSEAEYFVFNRTREEQVRQNARKDLLHWLRQGRDILHISGNAGSGKSTLMKSLAGHARTNEELAKWAGPNSLVVAEFYFWRSGSSLQRTVQGLYRSILFEVLSRCPELVASIFPRQLAILKRGSGDRVVESLNFGDEDIKEAFGLFVETAHQAKHRFCLFIDGLDECPGDALDQEALALMLRACVEGGGIKICASSRPYRHYLQLLSYPDNPTLHLHELNRLDISNYCLDRFQSDREVAHWDGSYRELVEEIVDNAKGVFLWAYLVVNVLLVAIRNGHDQQALFDKLKEIPTELNQLYADMRKHVEASETDRRLSNQMLLLAAQNPFKEPLNAISFSWLGSSDGLGDLQFPAKNALPYSEEEIEARLQKVTRQIEGLAQGFLQVVCFETFQSYLGRESFHLYKVDFFHRTARDYLLQDHERMEALQASLPGLTGINLYGRLSLAEYIFGFGEIEKVHPGYLSNAFSDWLQAIRDIDPQDSINILCGIQDAFQQQNQVLDLKTYPYPRSMYRLVEFYSIWHFASCPASFVHFAAHKGLEEFVFSRITLNPQLKHTAGNLNLFIAALDGEQPKFASALLENGIDLDDDYLVEQYGHSPDDDDCVSVAWPVWIVATIITIDQISGWRYLGKNSDTLALLERLVRHGLDSTGGSSVSFSFAMKSASLNINGITEFEAQDVQLVDLESFLEAGFADFGGQDILLDPSIAHGKRGFVLAQNSRWDRKLRGVQWNGLSFNAKRGWFRIF